ncbi:hypothetical protein [Hymenobacter ruricola]|uniref:Uncharacterized protein n=1 Tax=Hymenobacter ruricola TaxID=2791023 RepID=A0ABS0I2V1_9BACT|nr:hypothetical protein [Hymenobacter ruricola]MBF9220889.1 hypothetical protein [Hymenobacter ruricola]
MKYVLSLLLVLSLRPALAQTPPFTVRPVSLPKELAFYDNQFSGLAISRGKLYLLSESRLQDKAEAKLYTVPLADLDRKLRDTAYVLPFRKLPITGLPGLRGQMKASGQDYEGLEAMLIDGNTVYFSVETATPSTSCYILKGRITSTAVILDNQLLAALPKPLAADGSHVYNAGFEAITKARKQLVAFFEYNSFPGQNYVCGFDKRPRPSAPVPLQLPFTPLPFRITDITPVGKNHFTAINYFFKGDGEDAVYRVPATDSANTKLITGPTGFKNYCRLVDIAFHNNRFTWQPLWELPEPYMGYNWEGIAAYKGGYFIINDKYTPSRPYRTTLLYLQSSH